MSTDGEDRHNNRRKHLHSRPHSSPALRPGSTLPLSPFSESIYLSVDPALSLVFPVAVCPDLSACSSSRIGISYQCIYKSSGPPTPPDRRPGPPLHPRVDAYLHQKVEVRCRPPWPAPNRPQHPRLPLRTAAHPPACFSVKQQQQTFTRLLSATTRPGSPAPIARPLVLTQEIPRRLDRLSKAGRGRPHALQLFFAGVRASFFSSLPPSSTT